MTKRILKNTIMNIARFSFVSNTRIKKIYTVSLKRLNRKEIKD